MARFSATLALLLLVAHTGRADMPPLPELLYGVAYYPEYMPTERLAEDIRLMKEIGINTVRISESTWGYIEPREGVWNTGYLLPLLDALHAAGIHVIVGTPTYAIPPWLAKKHPDILLETKRAKAQYGARQQMDITNPHYRFYAERVIRKLMQIVAKHPAVIGYQIDNETKQYDNWNARVQRLFREHLQRKWVKPEAMNQAYGLHYWSNTVGSWADMPSTVGAVNASLLAEFESFQRHLATEFLAWQAHIVRQYARPDQFLTQNFDADWRNGSYGINPQVDQFEASRSLDVCGIDIYHPTEEALTGMTIGMLGDLSRSNKDGANYLVLETSGQSILTSAQQRLPYPGQLRLAAYSHFASGANMVSYWPWHSIHNGVETYWKGLLSHDMEQNETSREAMRVGGELRRLSSQLIDLKKHNQVAIYFSNEALTGLKYFPFSTTTSYNDLVVAVYDELYKMNVEVDFVDHTKANLSQYKLIVVPALYSARQEEFDRLNAFVAAGGQIIYTFKSGFADENLQVHHTRQPAPLRAAVGASYQQFTNLPDAGIGLRTTVLDVPTEGRRMHHFIELLMPEGAEVWATYDHPYWGRYAAITHHQTGNGGTTYLAGYPTPALLRATLTKAVGLAALDEQHRPDPGTAFPIIVRDGTNRAGRVIRYVLNYAGQPSRYTHRRASAHDLLSGRAISRNSTVEIPAWDLMILVEDAKS